MQKETRKKGDRCLEPGGRDGRGEEGGMGHLDLNQKQNNGGKKMEERTLNQRGHSTEGGIHPRPGKFLNLYGRGECFRSFIKNIV